MKFLIVVALAVACAQADVSHVARNAEETAEVTKYVSDIQPNGEYQYEVESSNGIYARAKSILKNVNAESPIQEVEGEYGYLAPTGEKIVVRYIANENGFQPQGDHLPVPPAIPEQILRSLEYNAAHPQVESKNEYVQRAVPVVQVKPVSTPFKPLPYKKF